MTTVLTVACDGSWDRGLPCRAAHPTVTASVGHAQLSAMRAGWRVSPSDGDLCPAHTRLRAEAERDEAPAPR